VPLALPGAGAKRQALQQEVRALAERHFGAGPLMLPLQTRMFVLDKVRRALEEGQAGILKEEGVCFYLVPTMRALVALRRPHAWAGAARGLCVLSGGAGTPKIGPACCWARRERGLPKSTRAGQGGQDWEGGLGTKIPQEEPGQGTSGFGVHYAALFDAGQAALSR
jgi:hypothetical protein